MNLLEIRVLCMEIPDEDAVEKVSKIQICC